MVKIKTKYKLYKKYIYLGQVYFIYCSSITVALVHVKILSKIHPVCRNILNGIEPRIYLKKTDKHAADCLKAVW